MARKHRVGGRSVSPTYRPLVTCHVSTGLSGYRNPLMMIGCRAGYPQPSIAGDDDVADRINPGRHPNGGPTGHRKPRDRSGLSGDGWRVSATCLGRFARHDPLQLRPRLFCRIDLDNLSLRSYIGEKSDCLWVAGEYQHLISIRKLGESASRTPCPFRVEVY